MNTSNSIRGNFYALRTETLPSLLFFAGIVGYVWTWTNIYPVTGGRAPLSSWFGGGLLLAGALLSQTLHRRYSRLSIYIVVVCIFLASVCAAVTFRSPMMGYVLLVPVIFASVFLRQTGFLLIAFAAGSFVLTDPATFAVTPLPISDKVLLIGIVVLITFVSWLSSRNLHKTLAWFSEAYESAYRNEQTARERQAELRRLLRALDEATHNLSRANHRLKQERNQAESARRMKQQLAQTISHELRTPLNIIVGFVDLMMQMPEYYGEQLPTMYRRDLSIVHKNAIHLQKLVSDVLDLARVEAAQMSLVLEPTSPKALIEDVVETTRNLVEAQGLRFYLDTEADLPLLQIDPTRIRQVLFNLISNAVRFTENGSVTLRVKRQNEEVIFAVEDTGVGIALDDVARVFDEFQQLDSGTRRKHGGVGLGLAISQRFVRLHNGRLWVTSELGEGSTFYFSLPVRAQETRLYEHEFAESQTLMPDEPDTDKLLLGITTSTTGAALLSRLRLPTRTLIAQNMDQAKTIANSVLPRWIVIDETSVPLTADEIGALADAWMLPTTTFIQCALPRNAPDYSAALFDGYLTKPVDQSTFWDTLRPFGDGVERILIIDYDRDFVRLVTRILENPLRRLVVTAAHSGTEGLALFRHQPPDLVLLDLQLPDMHGTLVLDQIRTHTNGGIPIIVISGEEVALNDASSVQSITVTHSRPLSSVEVLQWLQRLLNTST